MNSLGWQGAGRSAASGSAKTKSVLCSVCTTPRTISGTSRRNLHYLVENQSGLIA